MNQIIKTIKERRSIRKYRNKKIALKIIKEIIEAGRYAPSSHNSQPWRLIVITDRKTIKKVSEHIKKWFKQRIAFGRFISIFYRKIKPEIESAKKRADTGQDLFFYDAPLLVLICSQEGTFHIKDCSCAAQNMFLAARSLGIGSCWIGYADLALNKNRALMNELGVPKGSIIAATLVFGYPEKFPEKAFERKKEAGVVRWIK